MRPGTLQLQGLPPLSLYIHLPWCLKKCPYCDFNSHEWSATSAPGQALPEQAYLDALRADLEAALPLIWGRSVHSVFIGGGTPSLFSPEAIDRLLGDVRALLRLDADAEITLEANPGTFEKDRFRAFRQAGVTRLSIGVQSFNDEHLKALGRVHDRAQAIAAVEEAALAFDTFNLDIMYALPGQTLADCETDMRTALAFAPPHISIYHLTIEPNTVFAKFPPRVPEDDDAYAMLDRITELTAEQGLARYEVSAYAREGHRCWHNLNYWQFGDYLGIGAGAHSKLSFAHRVVRQVRAREPRLYMDKARAGDAVVSVEEVARRDLPFEYMLNALRLRHGFELQDFSARTGLPLSSVAASLDEGVQRGWLVVADGWVRPTERGFDFLSDLQSLFLPG
ncbi:MAG TPA: oxygen-independent coproporphyrinogen III oxidase-like protein [Hydrogenophaga sp.]|uniref:radical SAM family heme chaperone HemW n=1 Tax=Hydrogenophaga sp. TaxID=1904254 RepID=UPI000CB2943F|nr:radical SAM family heme chaperone HemW [Hydrogenophaga sp.]MBU4180453.1 radical SAM family heme chaperone HemW [Gammaproteobacteria bacterium]PKO77300.1 MAG: oxygen-independent coproporphyrinogen III oxidase-like protein [Betaproteobacteria bacterium HGW-Betaproteobacteria-15]MBU4281007.1 radical SAM family heme chaperone HemW [Gammaproteobacteria bacterium]MBU4325479.1 radical SAM family heme chaperone HemW [Gammaproteobacteria bacterium]MBU4508557.1 radical SAM family heme chaperone HemW 